VVHLEMRRARSLWRTAPPIDRVCEAGFDSSMMWRSILSISLVTFVAFGVRAQSESEPARTLKSFYSDGCTGFIDGPPGKGKLWQHCCFEHDLRYWFGGVEDEMDFADLELRACVNDVAGSSWAKVVYNGVRAGHRTPNKSKTHWSWGWTPKREKGPLTESEKTYVEAELRKLELDPAYVDGFVEKYLK
jgi:hypothetical protein